MSNNSNDNFKPGLEGVVAVETEIMEPDREGGSLRYRGVDVEPLVGKVPYENVWGLLVDNDLEPQMPEPEPPEPAGLTGNAPADRQAEPGALQEPGRQRHAGEGEVDERRLREERVADDRNLSEQWNSYKK